MRRAMLCLLLMASVVLVGCHTVSRGVHTVPVTRDYKQLDRMSPCEAKEVVDKAHRVGAQHYAPYEYFSAKHYLWMAYEEKSENDIPGMWDYSCLAKAMADAAVAKGGIPDKGPVQIPRGRDAIMAEFERLKGRLAELDKDKAVQVAPVLYAHAVAALSMAEHELMEHCDCAEAVRFMSTVEADIDTIWSQDVDGDGIIDMKDGAPWAPEDKDGFEDEDGIPDLDNDKDGILDADDVKPNDPETKNRWHDFDGAPDAYPALDPVHFASDSAVLSPETKAYLRGIKYLLIEWPGLKIHLAGHTDDTNTEEYNQKLSQQRAENVKQFLGECGVSGDQLVTSFHGETKPVADNKTADGRAQNRRVELSFE